MPLSFNDNQDLLNLAYIIGLAIGDGNLSNPNGRAVKLRITCDTKYPHLINRIVNALERAFPENKVSIASRPGNCLDVYCHSNMLEDLLGWKVGHGSKFAQHVRVPSWIKENNNFIIPCLRGLFETDGSIYSDRGYKMANFVTIIPELAEDVMQMMSSLSFKAHCYKILQRLPQRDRYNIRLAEFNS